MKKLLIASALTLSLLLSGCGNSTPSNTLVTSAPILTLDDELYYSSYEDIIENTEGLYEIIENEDGSLSYVVSSEFLEENRIAYYNFVNDEAFPLLQSIFEEEILNIEANEALTDFNIYLKINEIDENVISLSNYLSIFSAEYQLYSNNNEIANLTFFNPSEEIIAELTANDLFYLSEELSFYNEEILDEELLDEELTETLEDENIENETSEEDFLTEEE